MAQVVCVSICLFPWCVLSSVPGSWRSLVLHKHLIRINIQPDSASFGPPTGEEHLPQPPCFPRVQKEILLLTTAPLFPGRLQGTLNPNWSLSGQLIPLLIEGRTGESFILASLSRQFIPLLIEGGTGALLLWPPNPAPLQHPGLPESIYLFIENLLCPSPCVRYPGYKEEAKIPCLGKLKVDLTCLR